MPDDQGREDITEQFEMPITAEDIGFRPDELIVCDQCGRSCPPNRVKCLYCGAELGVSADQLKPDHSLRRPEPWEPAFNVVALSASERDNAAEQTIARMLGIEPETLRGLLAAELPIPLARVESSTEAAFVGAKLREAGISSFIVTDEELAADDAPRRLRAIAVADDGLDLVHFGGEELTRTAPSEIALIVTGAIYERSVTATEARRKGATKIIDSSESSSDESVVDFYLRDDRRGFRIYVRGFDFSALGERKGILGRENLVRLVEMLRDASPDAVFRDGYLKARGPLAHVWEPEEKRDSKGLTRQRFGKFDLSSVSKTSNLTQFTRYSRMLAHFVGLSAQE